jgi:hypothetical protein
VLIVRPVGADPGTTDLATGDVRITLRWADTADIDLSVTDPTGETVGYGNRSVSSGGTLDVDANAPCDSATATPAENIIWADTAPDGRYVITVNLYNPCTAGDSHPFQLTALVGGVPVQLYLGTDDGGLTPVDGAGTVSSAAPTLIFAFDLGDVTIVPDSPDAPTTDPAATSWEDASITILDLLLLDCGVLRPTRTWARWKAVELDRHHPSGDADFTTRPHWCGTCRPTNWRRLVSCGFYTVSPSRSAARTHALRPRSSQATYSGGGHTVKMRPPDPLLVPWYRCWSASASSWQAAAGVSLHHVSNRDDTTATWRPSRR